MKKYGKFDRYLEEKLNQDQDSDDDNDYSEKYAVYFVLNIQSLLSSLFKMTLIHLQFQ